MSGSVRGLVCVVAVAVLMGAAGKAARGQEAGGEGLAGLVPAEAIAYVERRGHAAVHPAMVDSNFGKLSEDETIQQFVHESRVVIGKKIVGETFDLKAPEEIEARRKLLHEVLKPLWYQPTVLFLLPKPAAPGQGPRGGEPMVVVLCRTGQYKDSCAQALTKWIASGVAPAGAAGKWQTFDRTIGGVKWQCLLKGSQALPRPKDAAEQAAALAADGEARMFAWFGDVLAIATNLAAAETVTRMQAAKTPMPALAGNKDFQAVMAKTAIKEWAFRWYVNLGALTRAKKGGSGLRSMGTLTMTTGMWRAAGVGGMEGYADKVYTRRTLISMAAPDPNEPQLFKPGGSYKAALAMAPRSATILLAGQLDVSAILESVKGGRGGATSKGAGETPNPAERADAMAGKWAEQLVEACDGNAALYVMDLQGLVGGMMGGGVPAGAVLGIKDQAKAREAVAGLVKATAAIEAGSAEEGQAAPAAAKDYRKVPISPLTKNVQAAVLADRVVLAGDRAALTAGIDAALDKTGGFPAGGKARELAAMDGEGGLVWMVDLPKIVRLVWPMLTAAAEGTEGPSPLPLVSLPSTEKLAELLGPEVGVVEAVPEGLLLKSRGTVPLITKMPVLAGGFIAWQMFGNSHGHAAKAEIAPPIVMPPPPAPAPAPQP